MTLNRCPFCEHGNPVDSKFCSACGGPLHLRPCPGCGAVNDMSAIACHQCRAPLQGARMESPEPASTAEDASGSAIRRRPVVLIALAALAAIVALVFYGYRDFLQREAPSEPVVSGDAAARAGLAKAGVIGRDAATADAGTGPADRSATPAGSATPPPKKSRAREDSVARKPVSEGHEPVESQGANAAAEPPVRSRKASEVDPGRQVSPRNEACTEAAAALGLCSTGPAAAAGARPQAAEAAKGGGQPTPREEACPAGVAALGLCPPESTQRRQ